MQTDVASVWVVDDDDDDDDQLFINMAFTSHQPAINIIPIRDGTELLSRLQACTVLPRLILLDVNIPPVSGFAILEELKRTSAFARVPIIMFTASSEENDRKRSVALGADHFLTKPNFYEELEILAEQLSMQWQLGGI